MRRFYLVRNEDETGVSGTGLVANGVQWADGSCVLRWTAVVTSTAVYATLDDLIKIHGHEGKTVVFWLDGEDVLTVRPESLCVRCFGGAFPGDDGLSHRCFDCGADSYDVMIPPWAVKAIREHDKRRLDSLEKQRQELVMLRGMLPVPDHVRAKLVTRTDSAEANDWFLREIGEDYFETHYTVWSELASRRSFIIKATSIDDARTQGATRLSWLASPTAGEPHA